MLADSGNRRKDQMCIRDRRYTAIICPIEIAGERLGTVFMYRCTPQYDIDDIIVSEYGTTCLLYTSILKSVSCLCSIFNLFCPDCHAS